MSKSQVIQQLSPKAKVPRNFILLDSLDRAKDFTNVAYGLIDDEKLYPTNSVSLEYWSGSIIYDDGQSDLLVFGLDIYCPLDFPNSPPVVKFNDEAKKHRFVAKMLDKNGEISKDYITSFGWDASKMGIGEYLVRIYDKIRDRY